MIGDLDPGGGAGRGRGALAQKKNGAQSAAGGPSFSRPLWPLVLTAPLACLPLTDDNASDDTTSPPTTPATTPGLSRAASSAGDGLSRGGSAALLGGDDAPPPGTQWKKRGKKTKAPKDRVDLYALLGLQHERWMASEAAIKAAYRRAALEHHPDKAVAAAAREAEEAGDGGAAFDSDAAKLKAEDKFKAIQDAWNTLSEPAKRREFDSTDAFDDTLPTDCDPADFFAVFGPAFRRNARWSASPGGVDAVPQLGTLEDDWPAVEAFYDFWYAFKSWREFPHEDEEDVECADSREEKRWLERHNARLREGGKKEEKKRLRDFVESAYELDPRVAARKAAAKAEREARVRDKAEARTRVAREAAAAEAAAAEAAAVEAEAAAAAAADAQKVRAKEKKEAQRQRARLRAAVAELEAAPGVGGPSLGPGSLSDAVDDLCAALGATALSTLADAASAPAVPALDRAAAVREAAANVAGLKAAEAAAKEAERVERAAADKADAAGAARARAAEWGAEEVRMLQKALTKFPAGTPKRWEAVAGAVRTRGVNEVIDMAKHGLASGKFAAPSTASFSAPAGKGAAATGIASAASTRAEAFTDVAVPVLAGDAAVAPGGGVNGEAAASPAKAAAAAPTASSPTASPGAAGADAAAAPWTEAQELALVRALKTHGKDLADRWDRVAGEVEGKTRAECVRRFKALKEGLKAKKAAA